MPELPDITVYLERLRTHIQGRTLRRIVLLNPFLLRTAIPPIASAEGRKVVGLRRLGKRIVIALEGDEVQRRPALGARLGDEQRPRIEFE